MTLAQQLAAELQRLNGIASDQSQTASVSGPDGIDLAIDFTAVDRLSCSLREIRLNVPKLVDADFDLLKQWAENLSRRVNYLLENIGPLEFDPDAGEVLIRSTPPDKGTEATQFYEVRLRSHSGGNFSLRRFRSEKGRPGRDPVDMHLTHEVLQKLARDLVETIP